MNEEDKIVIKESYDDLNINNESTNQTVSTPLCSILIDMLNSGIEFGFADRLELDIKQARQKYGEIDEKSEEFEIKLQEALYKLMCLYLKDNQIEKAKVLCESFDDKMEQYIFARVKPSYPVIIENDNYYCAMLKVDIAEKRNINVKTLKFWEGIYNIENPSSNYRLPEECQPEITSLVVKEKAVLGFANKFNFSKVHIIRFDPSSEKCKMNLYDIQKLKEYLIYKKNVKSIRIVFGEGIEEFDFDLDIQTNCRFYIKLPSTMRRINGDFFKNNKNIDVLDMYESQIEKIGESTFENSSIKTVKFPKSLTVLGKNAFKDCPYLERIDLLNTKLEFIKQGCFMNSGIKDIKFPSSLRVIEIEAFSGCRELKALDLFNTNVNAIDSGVISDTGLTKIRLGENIKRIKFDAFSDCIYLKKVDLSTTSVQKIGAYAFYNTNLRKIKMPADLTEIDYEAFSGCVNLTSIDLSKTKVERIASYAFYNSGISEVKFPKTLKYLSEDAFYGCENLKKLDLHNTKVEHLSANSFKKSGISELKF